MNVNDFPELPPKKESFLDLMQQAHYMLMDRSKAECDLIYSIAILDDEARTAIILSYQRLYHTDVNS